LSTTAHLYRHPDGTTHDGARCTGRRCFPPRSRDCLLHGESHPLAPHCMYAIVEWATDTDPACGASIDVLGVLKDPAYKAAYARRADTKEA